MSKQFNTIILRYIQQSFKKQGKMCTGRRVIRPCQTINS